MTTREAYVCDRCEAVALDTLPKGWIEGTNPTPEGMVPIHTCDRCLKTLRELQPFLEWLTDRVARWVHESKSDLGDLLAWNMHGERKLCELWDDYKRGYRP